ncbi:MAG: clostripain-related cysteine peptidase, partial [Halobacteriota archaeon]
METRSGVFAVAITVLLLMALTMNSVSAESKAKVKLGPSDMEKVKLNHTDAAKVKLNHTDAAKEKLNHSDAAKVNLNYTDVAKEELNHSDAAKVNLNHSDAAMENLNYTDLAKVALNPSKSMTFPTERAVNELIYDDGTAEDAYAWDSAGNGFAVQFTPPTYPVDIRTARICFWHDDWPDSDHEEFAVYVYDDDGPGGEPGTCLGGPIYHTAAAWGWCNVDISGLGITIENGVFYILYKQLTDSPDCEGLCRDLSIPQYGRSWDYYYDGSWDLWNENYMIRCVVDDDTTDEWTYMVYLDGDNNLEGAAIDDFMEMSSVGSSPTVNIVVQFDRIPGYVSSYGDWTDCKRFRVTAGMTPTAENALIDLGECNMGDPNTLRDFVDWAMTEFPADNYALTLWNHGDGWKSIDKWVPWADDIKDAKDAGLSRGICVDNTNNDYLSLQETEVALTGKYVQLLGYDACLMHMIEVVYQVMANAGVSVGSEEVEPWDGWPYDTILTDLTVTPTMNEDALGTVIVDRYMDSYGYTGSETQSAMDNYALPNLVTAVDNLAQALINEINGGHWTQVQEARNAAEEIYYSYYIDLYHFAEKIPLYVPNATAQAQAVMDSMGVAVYEEAHGTSVLNDHGLSIYYPRVEGDYLASYDSTAFASDTQWDEFLKRYYEGPELVCEGTDTSCGIYPNCENCMVYDGCYPYGSNGCEERNYYCVSNEAGCDYTYSNRHTDYYDDWVYYCSSDTVRRHRLFHDYYCDGGTCTDHTSLVDDQLVENCNDHDGWVDTGNTDWVPDPGNDCQEKERKEQEYRDYYCFGGACTYSETGTQWIDTGTTRDKADGTICGCTASNTLKRCYSGVCTDTGICNSSICGADAACDGKEPGDSCGSGGTCDSNCKCGATGDYGGGVYRNGNWILRTENSPLAKIYCFWWGWATDIPVTGDWSGGTDSIGVYRNGWWYLSDSIDTPSIDHAINWGWASDIPVTGDWNN